ncbi:hypothetical protein ABZ208_11545 [Streptomyces sp. NPDC006208]|uniref:hypothetical protein n=1 Tax=unclassified Streptomyces TaxID=2593676 RepID=UPI0033B06946
MGAKDDRNHGRLPRILGALAVTAAALLGSPVPAAATGADGSPGTEPSLRPVQIQPGEMADTGSRNEQLWLLGGVALSLTAAGVVAVAASRRRDKD